MREALSGLIDIELRPHRGETLVRSLYDALRRAILNGSLKPARRLPSSRELARQLKVSRNTVSSVVDQLAMEGYLEVAQGRRPVYNGYEKLQTAPEFKDYVWFHEYFDGDNGRGVGASHQTGWTGLVANLIDELYPQEFVARFRRVAGAGLSVMPGRCDS